MRCDGQAIVRIQKHDKMSFASPVDGVLVFTVYNGRSLPFDRMKLQGRELQGGANFGLLRDESTILCPG